jgi:hypothetical protein
MSRARLTLIALGMAFALPALAGAGAPAAPSLDPSTCTWEQQPDHDDAKWRWRLRAYRHLDCLTAVVDGALGTKKPPAAAADTVSITRAELEQIRTLATWARDAAARIGQ